MTSINTLLRDWARLSFNSQTQTERDSESKTDPETFSGFDDWNDVPLSVAQFLERVGPDMEHELAKSDASQVIRQCFVGAPYIRVTVYQLKQQSRDYHPAGTHIICSFTPLY